MADPTLKDVLAAIQKLNAKLDTKADKAVMKKGFVEMREGFAEIRAEMRDGFAKTNERFDRVEKQIAELDADFDRHMRTHREIERTSRC
jgi:hypothetical protein